MNIIILTATSIGRSHSLTSMFKVQHFICRHFEETLVNIITSNFSETNAIHHITHYCQLRHSLMNISYANNSEPVLNSRPTPAK